MIIILVEIEAHIKYVMPQRKKSQKSTSIYHFVGLNMKYFRMKNYGRVNMRWMPYDIHVASYIIAKKILSM